MSKNILFCGTTANFNLMEMMEKRIRSRFSQKTIFISIDNYECLFKALDKIFRYSNATNSANNINSKKSKKDVVKISLKPDIKEIFYDELLQTELFVKMLTKYIDMGLSIKEIITKIKYILCLISIELSKANNVDLGIDNNLGKLIYKVMNDFYNEENKDSYLNLLKSKVILTIRLPENSYNYDYKPIQKLQKAQRENYTWFNTPGIP
jgi:hypothetical protein